ncbi:MAG TPA: TlpA disulfide reductase family protein [Bryobacteraceae bacterium]|nr:TlpA disulfide reductase family protein [Bryobacteraceae bacterium]
MTAGALTLAILTAVAVPLRAGGIVDDVAAKIGQSDFAGAVGLIQNYRRTRGVTPEMLEAESWMARGELARRNLDQAEKYAQETYTLATAELKRRPLVRDPNAPLALALGASIEVQADVMAARGERASAVSYLRGELAKFQRTSIQPRIQKNINLLSLEGKPAPALAGVTLPPGKPTLLFFWAHWCPDCKAEAAVLKQVKAEFGAKGLVLVAPTQRYGYIGEQENVPPALEDRYIEEVRQKFYSGVVEGPLVVNEQNFRVYGASTTPTLVLIDRKGIVRMYHPGAISYPELRARIAAATF